MTTKDHADIVRSFREAKEPLKQIPVLADLYTCKPSDIKNVLISAGYSADELDLRRCNKPGRQNFPRKAAAPTGGIPAVLGMLREEIKRLDALAYELPAQIEALQRELAAIAGKKKAVESSIALLSETEK